MKLLSHSNGLHKVEKEKISKIRIIKRCIAFFLMLLAIGFIVQTTTKIIDESRLKSRFKYVRVDGNKMEYKLKGTGDYTVVFDGSIGTNLYEWNEVCKTLEEEGNVSTFVYNRTGYGFNDGGKSLTPEEQAQALKLLLRKSGASEPYILVGEEYGSLVLTNFVNLYSDSVAGVVLINPIDEKEINTEEFKNTIKSKYYRSKFETIGSNFYLTSLLSKMGLTIENKTFENSMTESELEEFNSFKNKKNHKEAVSTEIKNIYKNTSSSQIEGLFENKPLYIITDDENNELSKLGQQNITTICKEEKKGNPYAVINPESVVSGVNTVLKQARRLSKTL